MAPAVPQTPPEDVPEELRNVSAPQGHQQWAPFDNLWRRVSYKKILPRIFVE
jgi:hypothetical protein